MNWNFSLFIYTATHSKYLQNKCIFHQLYVVGLQLTIIFFIICSVECQKIVKTLVLFCEWSRIAQEQCCAAAVGDKLCDNGIKMSRWQGACERPFFQGEPWETQISKVAPPLWCQNLQPLHFSLYQQRHRTFINQYNQCIFLRISCLRLDFSFHLTVSLSCSDVLWLLHTGSDGSEPRFQLRASGFVSGETVYIRC